MKFEQFVKPKPKKFDYVLERKLLKQEFEAGEFTFEEYEAEIMTLNRMEREDKYENY